MQGERRQVPSRSYQYAGTKMHESKLDRRRKAEGICKLSFSYSGVAKTVGAPVPSKYHFRCHQSWILRVPQGLQPSDAKSVPFFSPTLIS